QAVRTAGFDTRQMAFMAERFRRKRPTNSATMCWASAAEPPLPQTSNGRPAAKARAVAATAWSITGSRLCLRVVSSSASASACQGLGLADVQAARNDSLRGALRIGVAEQRAGMSGRERAVAHLGLQVWRQIEQAKRVGDVAARFPYGLTQCFLAHAELVEQPA